MIRQLFIVLMLFSVATVSAQQLAKATANPSPPPALDTEMEFFVGLIDDIFHVNASLLCKNGKCNGELTYTESGVNFKLEGIKQGNTLLLQEVDEQSAISGFIKANKDATSINGEWSNFDGSIGSNIHLQKVGKQQVIRNLNKNKWVKIYRGIILWDEVQMILHHLGQQQVYGSIYYATQDEEKTVTGTIAEDGSLQLSIKNEGGMEIATLVEKDRNEKSFRAEFVGADGQRNYSSFELKKKIPVTYIEYADYVVSYEILFPEYANTAFNQWAKNHLKTWTKRCRTQVQAIKNNYPVCKPDARASERAYVWFEIEAIHNNFIIGHFFFSNTWSKQTAGLPINFNLKTGKEITAKQLFKKNDKSFKKFKKQYIEEELRRNPRYMDSGFREWSKKQSFPLFTIQKDGIQYSTYFDEIYGQTKVTIPYEKLKPYLKSNTPINKFF